MFREKSIFGFFKFPFCGGFSLHLHKIVHSKKHYTSCKFSKVFWNSLMLTSIYRARLIMGENTKLRRSITNEDKIMYKFNDKNLARYRYKQKQNLWNLWTTLVCSTQWLNLVSDSSYFPQVGLCDRSSRVGCSGEALNLCAKFSKFLFLSMSSLSLSEI